MLARLLLSISLLICVSCDLPRDPQHTLERVRGGVLRVGLIANEPWVKRTEGEPAGIEVALVRRFAERLDARLEWSWGNEHKLMQALKHYELDLVIGGLTQSSPWAKEIGVTQPFYIDRILVGLPPSQSDLSVIAGSRIAARRGEAAAAYLEREQALAERVEDPFRLNSPVAASAWELERHGFMLTGFELHKERHVMAIPPGENRWLMELDGFLRTQRVAVRELLREAPAP